jgi:hypothetical protein
VEGSSQFADTRGVNYIGFPRVVKICSFLILLFLILLPVQKAGAYYAQYKEEYYQLYHLHYIQYPDDTIENIYWLERALKADFANPLYALALIENPTQWEKYRYLFMMHLNLKMIEQYLFLGEKWNKRHAYFYNAPWKDQNLESLDTAESCFKAALSYWKDAVNWSQKAQNGKFRFINLERIQYWEDESSRIGDGSLNYDTIIHRELKLLDDVRQKFKAMDKSTY